MHRLDMKMGSIQCLQKERRKGKTKRTPETETLLWSPGTPRKALNTLSQSLAFIWGKQHTLN